MTDTNYVGSLVKILETPKQKTIKNNILITQFRVQFPQIRNTRVVNLIFWGKLALDVANHYKVNDYILVEGYVSITNERSLKKINITVLKVFPFFVGYDRSLNKV